MTTSGERRHKRSSKISKKTKRRHKRSRESSGADTCSTAKSYQESDLGTLSIEFAEKKEYVPKLKRIQVIDSRFHNVVDYYTYRFVNKSQLYDDKLAARTSKFVKQMEGMMELCIFDDINTIAIFRFWDRFKRSCGCSRVLDEITRWILSAFIEEHLRASSNNLIVLIGISRDVYVQAGAVHYEMSTFVEDVSYLLKWYATKAIISKPMSENRTPKEVYNELTVQFVDAVRLKFVRCGGGHPGVRIKEKLIDGLRTAICSGVRIFWGRELVAHLTELAQEAETVLDKKRGKSNEQREPRNRAFANERMRRGWVLSTVGSVDDLGSLSPSPLLEFILLLGRSTRPSWANKDEQALQIVPR